MITLPLYNSAGKEISSVKLDAVVFDGKVNTAAIYQAVIAYRANQRKGLAATKTRGEVSGGGKKPWRQKGTGRARVGSIRSPLWRHGGVIFGPHPRDFSYPLPKKIKALALRSSLNAKINENNLLILDSLKIETAKTKEAARIIKNLKINTAGSKNEETTLLLLNKTDGNLIAALRNLSALSINLASDTHAYEVMSHKNIIITKEALKCLTDRLNAGRNSKTTIETTPKGPKI